MPATIEIRVVFPQPEGPTIMSSSPARMSRSMPRSTWTRASPVPKYFWTPRMWTAVSFTRFISSPLEHDGRFELHHLADADQRRQDADQGDRRRAQPEQFPGKPEGQLGVLRRLAETRGQADPQAVSDEADQQGLEDDHPQELAVGGPHRLEGAEEAQVLEREVVEGLARDRGPDDEPEQHRDAEVHRDARVLHVVVDREL